MANATGHIDTRFVGSFCVCFRFDFGCGKRMEKTIGKRIKECRQKKGMTQEALAEALLIKKSTVSEYENDKIDMKISVLKEVAKALETSVSYLVGEPEEDMEDDVMQLAGVLRSIKKKELRVVAIAQIKVLAEIG